MAFGRFRTRTEGSVNGSMFGQDAFVIEILGGLRGGYFLDSGASDGVLGSNTYRLETDFGWDGICVEPNEVAFAKLARNRHCRLFNCCLYRTDGEAAFIEADVLGGILDDYHPDLLATARRVYAVPDVEPGVMKTVMKPTRTPRAVLKEARAPRVIDYWSLDTEGSELTILKSFPFEDYVVRVITVEHNHFPNREPIRAFLEALGYRWMRELAVDDAYVRGVEGPVPGWRSGAWRRGGR
jgi:hypothetical protein